MFNQSNEIKAIFNINKNKAKLDIVYNRSCLPPKDMKGPKYKPPFQRLGLGCNMHLNLRSIDKRGSTPYFSFGVPFFFEILVKYFHTVCQKT